MLSLPSRSKTVEVQIIDAAQMTGIPTGIFFEPRIKGWDSFNGHCYCFLITHTDRTGEKKRVIWDLGLPKDWENLAPGVVEIIHKWNDLTGFTIKVDKDVSETLSGNGVDLRGIEAVI